MARSSRIFVILQCNELATAASFERLLSCRIAVKSVTAACTVRTSLLVDSSPLACADN